MALFDCRPFGLPKISVILLVELEQGSSSSLSYEYPSAVLARPDTGEGPVSVRVIGIDTYKARNIKELERSGTVI